MEEVERAHISTVQQKDLNCAQGTNIRDHNAPCTVVWRRDLGHQRERAKVIGEDRNENAAMDPGSQFERTLEK